MGLKIQVKSDFYAGSKFPSNVLNNKRFLKTWLYKQQRNCINWKRTDYKSLKVVA